MIVAKKMMEEMRKNGSDMQLHVSLGKQLVYVAIVSAVVHLQGIQPRCCYEEGR